jgi:orotate phosphoribosyltransferase
MALGAVPIAVALSLKTRIPFVIIRKEEKMYGTAKQIEGEIKQGEKAIVVEDVATTGRSVKIAVDVLRSAGANCERALVVVDREDVSFPKCRYCKMYMTKT